MIKSFLDFFLEEIVKNLLINQPNKAKKNFSLKKKKLHLKKRFNEKIGTCF